MRDYARPGHSSKRPVTCVWPRRLRRAVGILVNGYSNVGDANSVQYLDEPQCEPFWAAVEELDVPLCLHPRIPAQNQLRAYSGLEFLAGSPWGFGAETATHALRLMVSGLFDRHPPVAIPAWMRLSDKSAGRQIDYESS